MWLDVAPRSRLGACSAFGYRLRSLLSAYRAPSVWVTWYRVACICSALPPCCCTHPLPLFSLELVPYPTPGAFVGVPQRVSEGTRIRKLY